MTFACVGVDLFGQHQLQIGPGYIGFQCRTQVLGLKTGYFHGFSRRQALVDQQAAAEDRERGADRGAGGLCQGIADNDQLLHVHAAAPVPVVPQLR